MGKKKKSVGYFFKWQKTASKTNKDYMNQDQHKKEEFHSQAVEGEKMV